MEDRSSEGAEVTRTRPSVFIVLILTLVAMALALGTASERSGGDGRDLFDVRRLGGTAGGVLEIEDLGVSVSFSSHSFGVTNAADIGGGGQGSGKAVFSPLVVKKAIDDSSPALMSAVATGLHSPTALVTVYKPNTTRAVGVFELEDVIVAGVEQIGAKGASETVSLKYRRMTFTSGGSSVCFDLVENISC
jgi:type VI protein secretion system component Hcp